MKHSITHRTAMRLGALSVALAAAAPACADPITPLWYGSWVDTRPASASFFIHFDRAPDLFTGSMRW